MTDQLDYFRSRPPRRDLLFMEMTELHQHFLQCDGACIDTRNIIANSMFFALKGPNFNANEFAAKALKEGCRYAVVDEEQFVQNDQYILVDNVLVTLQDLGHYHRQQFDIPVIGITGSNGKTTTKELMHAVLSTKYNTLATIGNLNNHIGVPLTLLRLNKHHEIAIIEMGANKPGDIAELCAIALPDRGMITNIGKAHLEGFRGVEGVIKTKSEMYDHLRAVSGPAFVHADDELLMRQSKGLERITYSVDHDADLRGEDVGDGPFLTVAWRSSQGEGEAILQLIGTYNLTNALAALCIGDSLGVPTAAMKQALESYTPSNNRSQWKDTGRNELIMDAYNANPTSVRAALNDLAGTNTSKKKLAILGDMFELGEDSKNEHQRVVNLLMELQLDMILVGPMFCEVANGSTCFATTDAALEALINHAITDRYILIKGSRGMKLERLFEVL